MAIKESCAGRRKFTLRPLTCCQSKGEPWPQVGMWSCDLCHGQSWCVLFSATKDGDAALNRQTMKPTDNQYQSFLRNHGHDPHQGVGSGSRGKFWSTVWPFFWGAARCSIGRIRPTRAREGLHGLEQENRPRLRITDEAMRELITKWTAESAWEVEIDSHTN